MKRIKSIRLREMIDIYSVFSKQAVLYALTYSSVSLITTSLLSWFPWLQTIELHRAASYPALLNQNKK